MEVVLGDAYGRFGGRAFSGGASGGYRLGESYKVRVSSYWGHVASEISWYEGYGRVMVV